MIFAAIYFKPRGIIAGALIGMLLVLVLPIAYLIYSSPTGSLFGTAYYAIHNGLGSSQDDIMRSLSPADHELGLKSLLINIMATTLGQISNLHAYLGAILAAPLFFIALLHPFKRQALAMFRWPLLLMWALAGIGMSIYGLKDESMDSNQIHILFAPLMSAYGLAMISILVTRTLSGRAPFFFFFLMAWGIFVRALAEAWNLAASAAPMTRCVCPCPFRRVTAADMPTFASKAATASTAVVLDPNASNALVMATVDVFLVLLGPLPWGWRAQGTTRP